MSRTKVQNPEPEVATPEKAFEHVVLEHQKTVKVFLARYIHCRQQVDDLAQDVFVTAYKQLKQFRRESELSTWLLGIARNKAFQFLRTETRRKNRDQFAESQKAQIALENLRKETNAELNEIRLNSLMECLAVLPEKSSWLIKQFYFEKKTAISIAIGQDEKESAIRMKLKRIREVLQKCIASKLHENE